MNGQTSTPPTPLYVNPIAAGNKGITTGIVGTLFLLASLFGYQVPGLPPVEHGTAAAILIPVAQNLFQRWAERRAAKAAAKK